VVDRVAGTEADQRTAAEAGTLAGTEAGQRTAVAAAGTEADQRTAVEAGIRAEQRIVEAGIRAGQHSCRRLMVVAEWDLLVLCSEAGSPSQMPLVQSCIPTQCDT